MSRIRVAFCIDSFEVGGTELNAVRTAEALDRSRFELLVVHLQNRGPLRQRYEALGIQLIHLPIPKLITWAAVVQGYRLAMLLRRWHADILHTHDLYTNIFAVPWVRIFGRCRILASRRWWFDAPRPGLVTLNRWSYRFAHLVLANCDSLLQLLQRTENLPVLIRNFLEEKAFVSLDAATKLAQRRLLGVPDDAFLVGMVARLAPVKNHEMLIRAAARLDQRFHFALIGDGPLRLQLEDLAATLGVRARFHFLGQVISVGNLHGIFDASVLCSTSEGFPNSVIEAMAAGSATIATPVGGVTDVVRHGTTGLIVESGSHEQLAAALIRLRDDSILRSTIVANARRIVRDGYHQDVVISKLSRIYESLCVRDSGMQLTRNE
jgi:glycosyltransferase involved in cell wall biosynthesis